MKPRRVLLRTLALFLSGSLVLPGNALALRSLNAGSEGSPVRAGLESSLAAGVEETAEPQRERFFRTMELLGLETDASIAEALTAAGYTGEGRSGRGGEGLAGGTVNSWRNGRFSLPVEALEKLPAVYEARARVYFFDRLKLLGLETGASIAEALTAAGYTGEGRSGRGEKGLAGGTVNSWRNGRFSLPVEALEKLPAVYEARARVYFFDRLKLLGLETDASIAETLTAAGYTGEGRSGRGGEGLAGGTVNSWRNGKFSLPVEALEKLPRMAELHQRAPAAGTEEQVRQAMAISSESVQGPGVVVIDAAVFPQRTGLEQLLKRLPVENRIVVVGAVEGSAAMQEIRARNAQIRFADSLQDAVPLILSLPAADAVSILGTETFARTLQTDLRQFTIETFRLDSRLGLGVLLVALGVPEEVLRQLSWSFVESALSSLEAA